MREIITQIVAGTLQTALKGLEKRQEELVIKGRIETITALLKSARVLRVLET